MALAAGWVTTPGAGAAGAGKAATGGGEEGEAGDDGAAVVWLGGAGNEACGGGMAMGRAATIAPEGPVEVGCEGVAETAGAVAAGSGFAAPGVELAAAPGEVETLVGVARCGPVGRPPEAM